MMVMHRFTWAEISLSDANDIGNLQLPQPDGELARWHDGKVVVFHVGPGTLVFLSIPVQRHIPANQLLGYHQFEVFYSQKSAGASLIAEAKA